MKKLYMLFVLTLLSAPAFCQANEGDTGSAAQPSGTESLAAKVTEEVPGDI